MRKLAIVSLVAVFAALLSHSSPLSAGTLTVTSGPTFTPDAAFTNNTIKVDTTVGSDLVRLVGGSTVTPDPSNQVSIALSGNYDAVAGDMLTAAYSFVIDLSIITPITYTVSGSAVVGGVPVDFSASGTLMPGLHKYEGTLAAPVSFPAPVSGTWSATLTLDFGGGGDSAAPGTLDLAIQQLDIQLDPAAVVLETPAQPLNISTRGDVGIDDNVMIGGFIVTGTDPIQVVLRAIGLSISDVTGLLADPFLELHDSTGALIATNDNWMDLSSDDQTVLTDNNLAPTNPNESALVMTLDPGAYTAIVRGVNNTTGVALVEAYDVDNVSGVTPDSKLANISTRGNVETDQNVLIGGFIVGGPGTGFSSIIVRGLGPSLASAGLTNVLADPTIELHNENGDLIAADDNWESDPNMQSVVDNGLAPTDPNEAAIFDILVAGKYTVILSGAGATSGLGLVEAYNVD
jgi:hypothetical protein